MSKILYIVFSIVIAGFGVVSCSSGGDEPGHISGGTENNGGNNTESSSDTVLVFQSGFEGNTRIIQYGESTNDNIIGFDPNLEHGNWNDLNNNEIRTMYINYAGGSKAIRGAEIVQDPINPDNKVLKYWMNNYWATSDGQEKARVQLELYDIKDGYKEFAQSVRIYIPEDFRSILKGYSKSITWFTISEFWNNAAWVEDYGFRVSLGIGRDAAPSNDYYFTLGAEDDGFKGVWTATDKKVKIPFGKWFTMYYLYKEGNKETGHFYMTITPDGESEQVVFDIHDFTHCTTDPSPNGLNAYNPMKMYTSKELMQYVNLRGKTLEIFWDDFKLWKINNTKK